MSKFTFIFTGVVLAFVVSLVMNLLADRDLKTTFKRAGIYFGVLIGAMLAISLLLTILN